MAMLLVFLFISSFIVNGIQYDGNRYPVFWNVKENEAPSTDVTAYDILSRNWTQVGGACSNPNCISWSQGVWPTISSSWEIYNGGVPQNANLTLHLEYIQKHLPSWIPDKNWNGNAVLDFEAWTTIWEYNDHNGDGHWHDQRYQNYSIQLAQKQYPNYNQTQIVSIAKQQFESAATNWFVQTLKTCSSIRPNARWGFYGLPWNLYYPCTGSGENMQCGYQDPADGEMYRNYSDKQIPIWNASQAIYPSIYIPSSTSYWHNVAYINNTVTESLRCAKNGNITGNLVYPYMWQKYHNGSTFLNENDLNISIKLPYNLGAQGLVIWGSSRSSVLSNSTLWPYFDAKTGPITDTVVEYVNECSNNYCSGHGKCQSLTSNVCQCDQGYSGTNCSKHY